MLDIGTRPGDYSIAKLFKYMFFHKNCGGCCGEIEVAMDTIYKDKQNSSLFNTSYFIRAAQFFEYKLSHSPDKCCESSFGFISCLPGAYSLFRWDAIQGGPMDEFFKLVNSDNDPTCA